MSDANVDIIVNADTSDATNELEHLNDVLGDTEDQLDETGDAGENMGGKLKAIGGMIAGIGVKLTAGITVPLLGMAGASIKMASDFNENVNKVDVVFGKNTGEVKKWAKGMIDGFGIAEGSALEMSARFGDFGSSMGLSGKTAKDMSMNLVELAGDMASFKNIGLDQAQTALQGIFTGEGEALKSMGVAMTVANLEAYAMAKGQKKLYKEMSEAEKIQLRYAYIMSVTKNSQGDFARTSDQFANVLRTVGERIKELGVSIGARLLPYVTPVVQKFADFLKKLKDLSPAVKDNLIWFGAFLALLGPIATAVGVILVIVGVFMSAGLALSLWVAGAVILFLALIAGLVLLAKNWTTVKDKLIELRDAIVDFKDKALTFIITKFGEFKQMLIDNEGKIKAVATVLEVIFAPALIRTAITAVVQGAIIVGSFVWSLICMGAQAIATGAIMTVQFVGSMIKTGATAILTGIQITLGIVASIIVYAAQAWIAVIKTIALTTAWIVQKAVLLVMKVAMLAWNIVVLAYNIIMGIASGVTIALGIAMAILTSPIGLVVIAIIALIAIGLALTGNWGKVKSVASSVWSGIKTSVGGAIDWIKGKIDKFKSAFLGMFSGMKMPHFTFTGSLNPIDWASGGLPHVGIKFNAKGGIFNKATLLGGNNVVGEAGSEAIIPLSNANAVKPFAKAVASQFNLLQPDKNKTDNITKGDVVITGNSFVIREEADITKIAEKLLTLQERNRRGKGGNPVV